MNVKLSDSAESAGAIILISKSVEYPSHLFPPEGFPTTAQT